MNVVILQNSWIFGYLFPLQDGHMFKFVRQVSNYLVDITLARSIKRCRYNHERTRGETFKNAPHVALVGIKISVEVRAEKDKRRIPSGVETLIQHKFAELGESTCLCFDLDLPAKWH